MAIRRKLAHTTMQGKLFTRSVAQNSANDKTPQKTWSHTWACCTHTTVTECSNTRRLAAGGFCQCLLCVALAHVAGLQFDHVPDGGPEKAAQTANTSWSSCSFCCVASTAVSSSSSPCRRESSYVKSSSPVSSTGLQSYMACLKKSLIAAYQKRVQKAYSSAPLPSCCSSPAGWNHLGSNSIQRQK